MRIWRQHELGEPGLVLGLEEDEEPTAGPGQVVVAIDAVGLSFPDVLSSRGEYQIPTQLPYTPGGESAGRVVAVGDGVQSVEVGASVVMAGGGLRELVAVSEFQVHRYPADSLTAVQAAAVPINYGTAWHALHDRGNLVEDETVLITGAAGGTGTACLQLAKAARARVIAVAGGAEKAELLSSLGADAVVDHHVNPAWVDTVRDLSDGGVDVVFDPVGGDTFHQARRCLAWGGRLLVIGFVGGIADAPTNHPLLKGYSIVGVNWGASLMRAPDALPRQMASVFDLARTGAVAPPLFPPFAFEDAAAGLQALADRKTWGKAVVDVRG